MERKTKISHLADDVCIIALAGIRGVCREDSTEYGSSNQQHRLTASYKGHDYTYRYEHDKEARNKMYNRLREALCPEPHKEKDDG